MVGETITVLLDGYRSVDLQVEEHHPFEPSSYCWDPGWTCYDGDAEYFVSESGVVFRQPENREVGVAPAIKAAADRAESMEVQ